jgi:hypothetical protein
MRSFAAAPGAPDDRYQWSQVASFRFEEAVDSIDLPSAGLAADYRSQVPVDVESIHGVDCCPDGILYDSFNHTRPRFAFRPPMFHLESPLLQEVLDLRPMVALDHNMPRRPVDHDLLLRQTQQLPQLIPQDIGFPVHLLHPSDQLVAAGFA